MENKQKGVYKMKRLWKVIDFFVVCIWKFHIKIISNPLKAIACYTGRKAENM